MSFVKLSTAADKTLLQCALNDPVFGVAQVGTHDAPGLSGSTAYAGIAGVPIQYFVIGDVCSLQNNPSGAGWTRGDFLGPDALGYGQTITPGAGAVGARALESVPAGQVGLVQIQLFGGGTAGGGVASLQFPLNATTLATGNVNSWQNTTGTTIVVDRIEVLITTATAVASTLQVGTTAPPGPPAANGGLMQGVGVTLNAGAVPVVYDNIKDAGTGTSRLPVAPGGWVTWTLATGTTPTALVGTLYIFYHL
jgi:hypothetical protein